MSPQNAIRHETQARVDEYLQELFEDPVEHDAEGHSYVRYGSTIMEIAVEPYGPEEALVHLTAYCVQGVRVTEELLRGLLAFNADRPIGAFALVDSDIYYHYTLLARSMQPRDLLGAIAAVAEISDEYDDKIVARYGGQTALQRIRDTGGAHRRQVAHPNPKAN